MRWLGPPGAEIRFPDPDSALAWPNGLLAAGGDLSPARLLAAYRAGIFPWFETGQPILWWSPDPRAVIFPGELHIARRLRRFLAHAGFEASFDQAFDAVLTGCARADQPQSGTWITSEMMDAYRQLHGMGYAHSVEIWSGETLVGGLYGVAIGGAFFAESMFSRAPNASKAAMCHLAAHLARHGFAVMDCQLPSKHLASMGAREIPRREFVGLLNRWVHETSIMTCKWPRNRGPVWVGG